MKATGERHIVGPHFIAAHPGLWVHANPRELVGKIEIISLKLLQRPAGCKNILSSGRHGYRLGIKSPLQWKQSKDGLSPYFSSTQDVCRDSSG